MKLIVCSNCNHRFPNNPIKHKHRSKFCPNCRTPYTKVKRKWKPNLNWIREKLAKKQEKTNLKWENFYKKLMKSYRTRNGRTPTPMEFHWEVINELSKTDAEKFFQWEKKRWNLK